MEMSEWQEFNARVSVGIVNQIKRLEVRQKFIELCNNGDDILLAETETALAVAYSNWLILRENNQ